MLFPQQRADKTERPYAILEIQRRIMITKKYLLLIFVVTAMVFAPACDNDTNGLSDFIVGSGNVVTEARQVSGFNGIAVSGAGEVIVDRTGSESLTITTDDNILEHLVSQVQNGILILGPEENISLNPTQGITYRITAQSFDRIELSGAIAVTANGIDTDSLRIIMSGACSVQSEGRADSQDIATSGASNVNGENLESRIVNISVSGSSYILVRVSELLQGQASGTAVIEYIGNPTVNVTLSGSAVVRPR
jgi:hypothetical protein